MLGELEDPSGERIFSSPLAYDPKVRSDVRKNLVLPLNLDFSIKFLPNSSGLSLHYCIISTLHH